MRKFIYLATLTIALGLFAAVPATADPLVFTATLTGSQEVPPVSSPGIGSARVTVDGNIMTVNATFSGLLGNTTAAHFHCCTPPGVNAMVATTVPTFPGFPLGVTSGTYSQTFDLTLASTYNPAFIAAQGGTVAGAQAVFVAGLRSGLTYFNIHTNLFPGGEIRGQLTAVPEPATMILLGTGLAGVGAAMRKRRQTNKTEEE